MSNPNSMTAAGLYNEMKNALDFFGLKFHQMNEMTVTSTRLGTVTFSYQNLEVTVKF